MSELEGKIAVVTGAGSGMGRAAAAVFARHGAKVVCADISGGEQATADQIGVAAMAVRCDVTQEADVEALMASAIGVYGRIDAVLNVAGISSPMRVADIDMAVYDRIVDVNLRGVVHGTKHGIRAMLASGGGTVLNWASTGAFGGTETQSIYCTTKAAVLNFTQSAALEYAASGIRAIAVCPGFVFTEMWGNNPSPEVIAARTAKIPQGRLGTPEEIAEVAAFLASDRASYINGAAIVIDGGHVCQVP